VWQIESRLMDCGVIFCGLQLTSVILHAGFGDGCGIFPRELVVEESMMSVLWISSVLKCCWSGIRLSPSVLFGGLCSAWNNPEKTASWMKTLCARDCVIGSISATVHREVIKDYATYFHAGTVVVLRQASTHPSCVFHSVFGLQSFFSSYLIIYQSLQSFISKRM